MLVICLLHAAFVCTLFVQESTTKPPPSFWTGGEWSWSFGEHTDHGCMDQNNNTAHLRPTHPLLPLTSFPWFRTVRVVSGCRKRVLVYELNCCWMPTCFCPQGHFRTGEVLHHLPLLFPRGSGESRTFQQHQPLKTDGPLILCMR